MYFSINRFTGNGTTTQWEFNFSGGYIDQAHVKVLVIDPLGVETVPTYTWVGPNTISIVPAVASGSTLEVYRDTPKNLPLVDYTDGAIVSEKNLDTTAEQGVFVAAEVFDRFSDTEDLVVGAATAAVEAAELAAVAAGTAASDASAAQVAASNAAVSAAAATVALGNIEADLDSLVGGDFSDFLRGANNLSDVTSAPTARINLGLGNVNNTADVDKPVSTAQASAISSAVSGISKTSIGLGNVDNTSDVGKPVSTAQAAAIAVAAQDVIDTFAAANGSNIVGFQQAGAGTVMRTAQDKLREWKHLRDFGVIGNGVADDSAAMAVVAAHSGVVIGDHDMVVMTGSLTITGALKLDMRGGSVKMRAALGRITINAQNVEFHNTVFDGAGLNVNVCFFRIPTTYLNWGFIGCTFKDITGVAGSANQYGIYADLDAAIGRIENCTFKNISNVSDGTPTSAFCGAMLLYATTSGAAAVRVENVTIQDVFCTGLAGNINNSDADGIRVFGPQPTLQSNLQIRGIVCADVQKSGIKVSGARGLVISDVTITNNRSDVSMVAGIRLQAADYTTVSNINLSGRMSRGINLRARNVVVDGVTYRPIDTARDQVPGGMVQFQSDDTYVTQQVTVSNVVAYNVAQAFDFDTIGTTIGDAFKFITLHHWSVYAVSGLNAGSPSRIQKAKYVTLDHVSLWDADGAWANAITCSGVSDVQFHYCRIEARREIFTWAPGDNGIEIDGCSFFRPSAFASENFRMLLMRDTSSGALDRVTIRNCTFSCPAYSTVGNQQCIFLNATNAVVDGVTIYVRVSGADVSPPSGWIGLQGSGYKISDIKVTSQSALTNGSGGYAVDLSALASGSMVTDVMNMSGPGVRANAGGNNNLIDSVAGKVTSVANSGTGNTVGSTHVLP